MTTYIGLLRAINLGAHNKIAMADLRQLLTDLEFEDPKTLVLSGNVVFGSPSQPAAKIERLLQDATAKHLGVTTDFFVRTAKEWQAIIAANPFPEEAKRDPGHLVMMCLKDDAAPGGGEGAAGGDSRPRGREGEGAARLLRVSRWHRPLEVDHCDDRANPRHARHRA